MSLKRTYLDSGVLITAFRGAPDVSLRAIKILDDPGRKYVSSPFVQLEILPKAFYHQQQQETAFYEAFLASVSDWAIDLEQILQIAERIARTYGLAAMDALHIAAAISIKAEEFITSEKPTKPMFRVTEITVISLQKSKSMEATTGGCLILEEK